MSAARLAPGVQLATESIHRSYGQPILVIDVDGESHHLGVGDMVPGQSVTAAAYVAAWLEASPDADAGTIAMAGKFVALADTLKVRTPPRYYQLSFTPEQRVAWEAAAKADNRKLAAWMRVTLDHAAAQPLTTDN